VGRAGADPSGSVEARFRTLLARPDEQIDLAEGALLIARHVGDEFEIDRCLASIEDLAERLRGRIGPHDSQPQRILALNRFLFEEQGFAPNVEDYFDPRNSFLGQVLERRLGIPISLSLVYIEVGHRIGLALQGVSFPGHFLVKCRLEQGVVVLDPYCGGISLTLEDLQQRLRDARGGEVSRAIVAGMLVSAHKREILARMLRNLKAIYLERRDDAHALAALDWIVLLQPGESAEVRDRGLVHLRLECLRAALADLERYLELAPEAPDADQIRVRVIELRARTARLN
jgi:regulator of sirC expression with transglutaminase-like and TPR domain